MTATRIPEPCRSNIARAIADAKAMRPVGANYDAVDLACDTDNFWWTGATLTNRQCDLVMLLLYHAFGRGAAA
jgi:hypothetical protein